MTAYYNEFDPYAAQWLRNLIAAGHIAPGDVDERSIEDVTPTDLAGYVQCHFFAGIGGWSYALRLAGWDDARSCWTGSCPCQPFSAAGQRKGTADDRHLWPAWYWLIQQCRPSVVFGEQVSAAVRHVWLDLVCADLEALGYACGPVVVPACSVGAPHIRQRLWFVAESERGRREGAHLPVRPTRQGQAAAIERGAVAGLADTTRSGLHVESREHREQIKARKQPQREPDNGRRIGRVADADQYDSRRQATAADNQTPQADRSANRPGGCGESDNPWSPCDWLPCRDGKSRPTQSGFFPLAHGVPARVGRLRAYGNAIVPQVAAAVIRAYLEVTP